MARIWFVTKEKFKIKKGTEVVERLSVRSTDGKRYPKKEYAKITSQYELENFVIRLNGKNPIEERAKEAVKYKHAYIDQKLRDDYQIFLASQIPNKKDAKTKYLYLNIALRYFIGKRNLVNPLDWHQEQHVWSEHLLQMVGEKRGEKYSAKVLKEIVYELNRFVKYLHIQRPKEVPSVLTFEPLSKAALKLHEAKRKGRESKYIKDEHWKLIEEAILKDPIYSQIYPVVKLSYLFGLRRNEVLGLTVEDVRMDHLRVERQWGGVPLKNRQGRKVPYWFTTPEETYELIKAKPDVHPDYVTELFVRAIKSLGSEIPKYIIHDIRRTWITNCVRKKIDSEEVRLAAGHSNINTTYRFYVMDSRELNDKVYKPGMLKIVKKPDGAA